MTRLHVVGVGQQRVVLVQLRLGDRVLQLAHQRLCSLARCLEPALGSTPADEPLQKLRAPTRRPRSVESDNGGGLALARTAMARAAERLGSGVASTLGVGGRTMGT